MSTLRCARALVTASGLVVWAVSIAAVASADDVDRVRATVDEIRVQADGLGGRYLKSSQFKGDQYAAERLIDGENFYRIKDYSRAAIVFMDVIENYSSHAAYPDALFLYADSLFLARDYLGSREWFRKVLDSRNLAGIKRFRSRSIERLIEIAIHINDFEGVDKYFDMLGQIPTMEARYVKGKYLYFKGDMDAALRELTAVKGDSLLELRASYMVGVVLTRQERYEEAVKVFLRGGEHKVASRVEQEIVDLMRLGAGRLYYELGLIEHASESYQRVEQNSPYFDSALYEAATVLIRGGDTIRAEQTLEVLTVALPDSKYIPRAQMLRGNLLLRTGRYDEAEKVFDGLISELTPVRQQLDELVEADRDTNRFFFELMQQSLVALDVTSLLPPLAVKWVGEEREVQRALDLTADLGAAKDHVRETARLVRLLEAVIDGPSGINAIPLLREAKRRSQQLGNRLSQLRGRLGRIAVERLGEKSSELVRLDRERRKLSAQLKKLPTSDVAFERREEKAREVFSRMRHELSRNQIRMDQLSAMIVAIERFIGDPAYIKDVPTASLKTWTGDLERHRQAVAGMGEILVELRNDVDSASYQVGVGDSRDREDLELKKRIRKIARKERELLAKQGGKAGKKIERVHAAIDDAETVISRFERQVDAETVRQIDSIKEQVKAERVHVSGYRAELRSLDAEAEEVVGGMAYENFSNVRSRFHELILKADVGVIDVAWLRKEEHRTRISDLTRGRLNDIKVLDDEFQEVKEAKDQ